LKLFHGFLGRLMVLATAFCSLSVINFPRMVLLRHHIDLLSIDR